MTKGTDPNNCKSHENQVLKYFTESLFLIKDKFFLKPHSSRNSKIFTALRCLKQLSLQILIQHIFITQEKKSVTCKRG